MTIIDLGVILLGLAVGSFLNVCIYRIPREESVVLPSSRCPHCDKKIRPWHNIPVLGYLLLRGRCADCGAGIGWIYPTVEIMTALLFYGAYLKFGWGSSLAVALVFFSILVALNFIDLFERILPNVITLGGAVVGLLLSPFQSSEFFWDDPFLPALGPSWVPFVHSLAGVLLGGGVLWLTAFLYLKIRKIEGMGFGDIKMMAMVGAFLGWRYAWLTIFAGSILGAVIGTVYIAVRGKGQRYELPFGTFLALGAVLVTFWGPQFLAAYLEMF